MIEHFMKYKIENKSIWCILSFISYGHWVCFHLFTPVSSAAMNICVPAFIWIFTSLGYIPRSGVSVSYVNYLFSFLRNCQTCFSQRLYHFTFLPTVYEDSNFSTSLPHLFSVVIFFYLFFHSSHPSGCLVSDCG